MPDGDASGKADAGRKAHHREGVPGLRAGDASPLSAFFRGLIHYILREELRWEAQLYRQYPRLRKKGAPLYQIHTPRPDISFELSIQGELYTYSRLTLQTLLAYITQLRTRQRNFNKMVWQNICRISGYAYLQEEA